MHNVKRFDLVANEHFGAGIGKKDNGKYCLFEDFAALQKRLDVVTESHNELRDRMAAIHNTIKCDGAATSLSVLLSASARAWEISSLITAPDDAALCYQCGKVTLQVKHGDEWHCAGCHAYQCERERCVSCKKTCTRPGGSHYCSGKEGE